MNEQGLPVGYSPITYFSNEADAVAVNFAGFLGGSYTTTVGAEDYGNLQGITHWRIASSSTGSSSQIPVYNNGDILNNDGYYFMFPGYPLTHTIQETTAAVFPTPPPQATTGSFVNPLVDPLFTPASITSLKGWWDANDPYGNGTQPAPLSVVATWNDKSQYSNHATIYNNIAQWNLGLNGKGHITFGANDYYTIPDNALPSGASPFAYYVVMVQGGGTPNIAVATGNVGPETVVRLGYFNNNTVMFATDAGTGLTGFATYPTLAVDIYGFKYDGSTTKSMLNFTQNTGPTQGLGGPLSIASSNSVIGGGDVGNSELFTGDIYEVIVYDTIPTQEQEQKLFSYLGYKYGFQSDINTLNPYKNAPANEINYFPPTPAGVSLPTGIQPWNP
jgi:hypothetical protein